MTPSAIEADRQVLAAEALPRFQGRSEPLRPRLREDGPVASEGTIVGVSLSLILGEWDWPVHGLRHMPEGQSNGWYVWTGDLSQDEDFFQPLHADHLLDRCPEVAPLLDLPPGSRFLLAPGHLDTWRDPSLLDL